MTEVFRQRATYCREMAEKALTQELKADWLKLAETWLTMAGDSMGKSEADFEAEATAKGTGQKDSTYSH